MASIKMNLARSASFSTSRQAARPAMRFVVRASSSDEPSSADVPPSRTGGAGGASRDVNFSPAEPVAPARNGGAGGASRDVMFSPSASPSQVPMPPSDRPSGAGRRSPEPPARPTSAPVVIDRPGGRGGASRMSLSMDDNDGSGTGSSNGDGGKGDGKGDGSSGSSSSSGGGFNPVFLLALLGGAVFVCLEINKRFIAPAQEPAKKDCCSCKK